MAFHQREQLAVGDLIGGSFSELRGSPRPVLIYLAANVALGLVADSAPPAIDGLASLAGVAVYFVAQYLLFEAMLRNAGHISAGQSRRMFRFVGLAFVVFFGVMLATYLFVIPGLLVAARWIMAPSILVGTQHGVFASLRQSWSLTSGNTLRIALALMALLLIAFVATVAFSAVAGAVGGLQWLTGALLLHGTNLVFVGLSIAAYRRLNETGDELAEVFA